MVSKVTKKLVILQTHFSTLETNWVDRLPGFIKKRLSRSSKMPPTGAGRYNLSPLTENEQIKGRWYTEFSTEASFQNRDNHRWASWGNRRSFWIQREYLLQTIRDVGFDLVLEQYDSFEPGIAQEMLRGSYKTQSRGTFIGIKT